MLGCKEEEQGIWWVNLVGVGAGIGVGGGGAAMSLKKMTPFFFIYLSFKI